MSMKRRIGLSVWMALTAPWALAAPMTLELSHKDGDTISGDVQFTARVRSEALVTSVEFYIGDNLRETDQSTPYQFNIDTLTEDDGPFSVTFAAYNSEGGSVKKTLRLKIDNGLNKGVGYHVGIANEALQESQWAKAILHGRTALRIDGNDNSARLVLARANLGAGVLDLAQKFAEDIVASDPANVPARQLLSGINLRRAFLALERGTSDNATLLGTLTEAFRSAATNQNAANAARIDAMGEPTDETLPAYADALLDIRRFNDAARRLAPVFAKDPSKIGHGNRLIYAYLRSARLKDAAEAIDLARRSNTMDAETYALAACFHAYIGETEKASAAMKEALLLDPSRNTVVTAQIFTSLRAGNLNGMGQVLQQYRQSNGDPTLTGYYQSVLLQQARRPDEARIAFENAILTDAASYELLTERAIQAYTYSFNESLSSEQVDRQRGIAKALLEAAIEARPDSFEALTALAMLAMQDGNKDDTMKWARAAVEAAPEYAGAQYALAGALQMMQRPSEARKAMEAAGAIDRTLVGVPAPGSAVDLLRYLYSKGRTPWLAAPGR